jgi:hypothetical protein
MKKRFKFQVPNLGSFKRQGGSSILGLSIDAGRIEGVVLRRTNGSVQIQQAFSTALSLDPLTNAPELVGREIRNHLLAAGVRERRCVVALPLHWALTAHTKVPELPEGDVASYLSIEAERTFPCDVSTLMLATSRSDVGPTEKYATVVGISRNHVSALDNVLRAAQLKPVSFSLGLPALQPPESAASNGVVALAIGESHVGLQVTAGGGIVALRTLKDALETEAGQRQLRGEVLTRELRITLGQLSAEARRSIRRVRIFGSRDLAQRVADEIELRLEAMELDVELVSRYSASEFQVQIPSGAAVSEAFSLAARQLAGTPAKLEFLPPRVTKWQQYTTKYSSGRLQQAGIAAGAIAVVVAGAFLVQQIQLWRLQSQWSRISTNVEALEAMNGKIKQFRPWFDESVRSLRILRQLTEAFPEDGSVTAKTLEIRDLTAVTCSGVARDYQSLLRTVERLRAVPQIPEVNLGQTRGQSPNMQFTFNFVWSEGGGSGN